MDLISTGRIHGEVLADIIMNKNVGTNWIRVRAHIFVHLPLSAFPHVSKPPWAEPGTGNGFE